jgi:hypothetical protein
MRSLVARTALAIVTAAAVLLGDPTVATAAPMKFDALKYLECANYWGKKYSEGAITEKELQSARRLCCASSGGEYQGSGSGGSSGTCKEPANTAAPGPEIPTGEILPATPVAPVASNGGIVTQTLTPALATAPPGDSTQTFEPVP